MKRGPIWMIAFLNCTHFDRLICMLSASIAQKESQLRIFFLLKWYLWNFLLCGCNYKGINRNGLFSHSRNHYCGNAACPNHIWSKPIFAIKMHFDVGRVQLLQLKKRLNAWETVPLEFAYFSLTKSAKTSRNGSLNLLFFSRFNS